MRVEPKDRKIGILLSGRGSNFKAIADQIALGNLDAEIRLVLSNRESSPGLEEAHRRGLHGVHLDSTGLDREEFDRKAVRLLHENGVSLVCLAGFMRILSAEFIASFPWAILNIHPSLLPAFPGLDAQRQALEHGVKWSGCTVHFVDESLDGGPIIMQSTVPVQNQDSIEELSERILAQEHRIYSEAIGAVLGGRCEVRGRRVVIHETGA